MRGKIEPIDFPEANQHYLGGEDILPLPVWSDGEIQLACWKISMLKRIKLLITGKIWVCCQGPQPPMWLDTEGFENENNTPDTD